MKVKSVYKSNEGKRKIIDYYDKLISRLDIEYKEIYIDTSYGKTHLVEAGRKELPVAFLFHGSCSNSAMWFGDIKDLCKKYHVFLVDIIGEPGKSSEKRYDVLKSDYAYWVNEIFDFFSIDKAILIGNSYGGWMILKFATNFPARVKKIVLIGTSGLTKVKFSFLFKTIIYSMQGETGLYKLNKLVYGKDNIPDEVIKVSNMIMENFNPMIVSLPIFNEKDLQKLTMPIMYIAGENDVTVNVHNAKVRLENYVDNSRVEIIKNNGHVVYDVMDKVIPFLDEK